MHGIIIILTKLINTILRMFVLIENINFLVTIIFIPKIINLTKNLKKSI